MIYMGPYEVESMVTDRTPVLRVCVNLIMLTDYRFKYFKSHRAHAASDEESEMTAVMQEINRDLSLALSQRHTHTATSWLSYIHKALLHK